MLSIDDCSLLDACACCQQWQTLGWDVLRTLHPHQKTQHFERHLGQWGLQLSLVVVVGSMVACIGVGIVMYEMI